MPSKEDAIQIGIEHVEHEGNQPHEDTGSKRHGQGQDQQRFGIERSIRPDVPCPETVLVAVMSDGSYLLVGYPRGEPTAFVAREEAELLKQALTGAFENPRSGAASGNGSTAAEREALQTKQVQP